MFTLFTVKIELLVEKHRLIWALAHQTGILKFGAEQLNFTVNSQPVVGKRWGIVRGFICDECGLFRAFRPETVVARCVGDEPRPGKGNSVHWPMVMRRETAVEAAERVARGVPDGGRANDAGRVEAELQDDLRAPAHERPVGDPYGSAP